MIGSLRNFFAVLLVLLQFAVARADQTQAPFYLSYEQRILISYALLAQGASPQEKSEIVDRVRELILKNVSKGVQKVKVDNFDEFLKLYRGEWPDTNSLELDMKTLEGLEPRGVLLYESSSPRIQRKIENFIREQAEQLITEVKQNKNRTLAPILDSTSSLLSLYSDHFLNLTTQKQLDIGKMALDLSDVFISEEMKQLDQIGDKLANTHLGNEINPNFKITLQILLTKYFSGLSPKSKKQIASAYLGGNLRAPELEKFGVMVQNSGPQLQKMLQVVAREGNLPPEILVVFRQLESSVRAVPWVQVEKLLEKEKGNYEFIYFEKKPLGVGSMAQVHRAKIMVKGIRQDVVVRFIKPDILDRVHEDHRILLEIAAVLDARAELRAAGLPKLTPLVEDITRTVTAEFDQNATVQRQRLGDLAYSKQVPFIAGDYKNVLDIHVAKIFPPKTTPSALMVQEMLLGTKLDKEADVYRELIPDFKKTVVEQIAKLWLNEVLFGGGFFHSDLHPGNFLVRFTDPAVRLGILDFGMGGVLDLDLRGQFLVLGAGIEMLNAKVITKAFWALSDKDRNNVTEEKLRELVREKVHKIKKGEEPALQAEMWTAWALNNGLRLPYAMINLNRGLAIVGRMLVDAGSTETMSSLAEKLILKHPVQTYKILTEVGGLSALDLVALGWSRFFLAESSTARVIEASQQVLQLPKAFSPAPVSCRAVFAN